MGNKRILITGGSGFIGRNLAEFLRNRYEVSTPSHSELDILDQQKVCRYLKLNKFDIVIHSANTNNTLRTNISDYDVLSKNLRMYWNLATCTHLYEKLIYFGSGAEYDMQHYVAEMNESYFGTYIPKDAYGFSKYIMNQNTRMSDNIYNLRLFGVYGKYEEWNRRFISNNICRVLSGTCISINKNAEFDYLYINDLCHIVTWFINHTPKYHDYNVCSGQPVSLLNIAKIIQSNFSDFPNIRIIESGEKLPYSGNNERMIKETGNIKFTDLKTGICELIEFYQYLFQYDKKFISANGVCNEFD